MGTFLNWDLFIKIIIENIDGVYRELGDGACWGWKLRGPILHVVINVGQSDLDTTCVQLRSIRLCAFKMTLKIDTREVAGQQSPGGGGGGGG